MNPGLIRHPAAILLVAFSATAGPCLAAEDHGFLPADAETVYASVEAPSDGPPAALHPVQPRDSLRSLPPGMRVERRHMSTAQIVILSEFANAAYSGLSFVPHASKPMAGVDGLLCFVTYMAPMDMDPSRSSGAGVLSAMAAVGFAAMAVANWGNDSRPRIQLSRQQKFWMNVAGPNVIFGLTALTEWAMKRRR